MKYKELLEDIAACIERAADALGVPPLEVTKAQLYKHGECQVSEWELRKVGGIQGVKRLYFTEEKDLTSIRHGKEVQKRINQLEKALSEKALFEDRIARDISEAITKINVRKEKLPKVRRSKNQSNMTMELMISDVHYGLKTKTFNNRVCRARMRHLTAVFLRELEDNQKLFNVERIIIALLGDIIQSYTMHGLESATSCEFGNFQQIESAFRSLYYDVILPIAKTGIRVDIPAVTGNHDRTETKRTYNYPGLNQATWAIYSALEMLCKEAGLTNVTFDIPHQAWAVVNIYGCNYMYEHLDNAKAPTREAIEQLIKARQRQENKVIHGIRGGHFHFYLCIDRGRIIINESVPGSDPYGETLGYESSSGQTLNFYIETSTRPTPFYKSFPICLGHITGDE